MQAIPVFADDDTKSRVDFSNGAICNISTESQIYYTEYSYDDIIVPVYLNLTGTVGNVPSGNVYFSGYIYGSTTAFNFTDSNSNRYVISYFESVNDNIRTTYYRSNAYWNIFLDNVILSNNNKTLIGYLHLMGNEQNTTLTLNCNNSNQTLSVSSHNLYYTTYEYGFVNAMVYALENSANLDGMYNILNHIENASLPEILTTIQTNHTALYNLINSVWLTDQSVLSVSQQTYNTVLSILNILNSIDDTLDNISWINLNVSELSIAGDDLSYINTGYVLGFNHYIKFNSTINPYGLIHIRTSYFNGSVNISPTFKVGYFINDVFNEIDSDIYAVRTNYRQGYLDLFLNFPFNSSAYPLIIKIESNNDTNKTRLYQPSVLQYINFNDIEYWKILNALKTNKIADILYNQYEQQVNQADAIKDEVDTNLQNLAQDIVVTKPSQVANIADDYIEQVDTTHNYQVFSWLSAPTFVLMMSIVAGLAVISYMLYGGQ